MSETKPPAPPEAAHYFKWHHGIGQIQGISLLERGVLAVIHHFESKPNGFRASNGYVADYFGVTENAVAKALSRLRRRTLIKEDGRTLTWQAREAIDLGQPSKGWTAVHATLDNRPTLPWTTVQPPLDNRPTEYKGIEEELEHKPKGVKNPSPIKQGLEGLASEAKRKADLPIANDMNSPIAQKRFASLEHEFNGQPLTEATARAAATYLSSVFQGLDMLTLSTCLDYARQPDPKDFYGLARYVAKTYRDKHAQGQPIKLRVS